MTFQRTKQEWFLGIVAFVLTGALWRVFSTGNEASLDGDSRTQIILALLYSAVMVLALRNFRLTVCVSVVLVGGNPGSGCETRNQLSRNKSVRSPVSCQPNLCSTTKTAARGIQTCRSAESGGPDHRPQPWHGSRFRQWRGAGNIHTQKSFRCRDGTGLPR